MTTPIKSLSQKRVLATDEPELCYPDLRNIGMALSKEKEIAKKTKADKSYHDLLVRLTDKGKEPMSFSKELFATSSSTVSCLFELRLHLKNLRERKLRFRPTFMIIGGKNKESSFVIKPENEIIDDEEIVYKGIKIEKKPLCLLDLPSEIIGNICGKVTEIATFGKLLLSNSIFYDSLTKSDVVNIQEQLLANLRNTSSSKFMKCFMRKVYSIQGFTGFHFYASQGIAYNQDDLLHDLMVNRDMQGMRFLDSCEYFPFQTLLKRLAKFDDVSLFECVETKYRNLYDKREMFMYYAGNNIKMYLMRKYTILCTSKTVYGDFCSKVGKYAGKCHGHKYGFAWNK